jgi:hypothetical protein
MRIRALLLLGLAVMAAAGAARAAGRTLSSEVKLEPGDRPDSFVATVELRDAVTQELLAAPKVAFLKGKPVKTSTTLDSGEELTFTIQVDAAGGSAIYTAEIRVAGQAVAIQKATIALR